MKSKAMSLFEKGRYRAAVPAFKKDLARDKDDTWVLFYLALSLYELGQFRRALQYWNRVKHLEPAGKNVHLNIGCVWQNLGRNDLAILNFKKELEINPVSGEALYSIGTLYYNLHRYKQAVGYLERCYFQRHSVEQIVDRLADSYFKTGQLDKEIELYQDWLQTHPEDAWGLNNLGAALMHVGEYSRAQLYLRKANRTNPEDKMVLRNLRKVQSIQSRSRLAHQN